MQKLLWKCLYSTAKLRRETFKKRIPKREEFLRHAPPRRKDASLRPSTRRTQLKDITGLAENGAWQAFLEHQTNSLARIIDGKPNFYENSAAYANKSVAPQLSVVSIVKEAYSKDKKIVGKVEADLKSSFVGVQIHTERTLALLSDKVIGDIAVAYGLVAPTTKYVRRFDLENDLMEFFFKAVKSVDSQSLCYAFPVTIDEISSDSILGHLQTQIVPLQEKVPKRAKAIPDEDFTTAFKQLSNERNIQSAAAMEQLNVFIGVNVALRALVEMRYDFVHADFHSKFFSLLGAKCGLTRFRAFELSKKMRLIK